jgi:hypothetical protein
MCRFNMCGSCGFSVSASGFGAPLVCTVLYVTESKICVVTAMIPEMTAFFEMRRFVT